MLLLRLMPNLGKEKYIIFGDNSCYADKQTACRSRICSILLCNYLFSKSSFFSLFLKCGIKYTHSSSCSPPRGVWRHAFEIKVHHSHLFDGNLL